MNWISGWRAVSVFWDEAFENSGAALFRQPYFSSNPGGLLVERVWKHTWEHWDDPDNMFVFYFPSAGKKTSHVYLRNLGELELEMDYENRQEILDIEKAQRRYNAMMGLGEDEDSD